MPYPQYSKIINCLCYLHYRNDTASRTSGGTSRRHNRPFSAVVGLGWQSTDKSSDCSMAQNSLKESIEAMAEKSSPSVNAGQTAPAWFEVDFSAFQIK